MKLRRYLGWPWSSRLETQDIKPKGFLFPFILTNDFHYNRDRTEPVFICLYTCQNFFKRFYLFIFRQRGREGGRRRNISVWLPLAHHLLETWPTTQAWSLTGNRTSDPLVNRPAVNPLGHTSQSHMPAFYFQVHNYVLEWWILVVSVGLTSLCCSNNRRPNVGGSSLSHALGALQICREPCSLSPPSRGDAVRAATISNITVLTKEEVSKDLTPARRRSVLTAALLASTCSLFARSVTWPHPTLRWPRSALTHVVSK